MIGVATRRVAAAGWPAALFAGLLAACAVPDMGPKRPEMPVPTPEGLVDASDPQPLSDIAWRYGEATWRSDGFRDPLIEATANGRPYRIEFYGCSDGRDCTDIRFVADAVPGDGTPPAWTPEGVAAWNAARRFGKAGLDEEGRARVEMNAVLQGGVTRQNLDALFDWWMVVLAEFDAGPSD
jgi:hypothetical protein